MKYYLLLVLLFSASLPTAGQIPTPDFRYYSSCPTSYSQVSKCSGWVQPTSGTSDYFNVCASGTNVGVPQNFLGYQAAATNAYMGLYTYALPASLNYKEYISTDFAPLTVGQTYTMTIIVSLADSSKYATDGLGVFFTTYAVSKPNLGTTLLVTPQVDYSNYGTIKDKVNWVKMSKSFVADSAYTHLVLGCFKPYGTLKIDTLSGSTETSYYYIGQIGEPDDTRHAPTDSVTPPSTDIPDIITLIDSSRIVVIDTPKYAFPNAFTPNKDSHNDVFRIISSPGAVFSDFGLHIFNRWGQRIFFSNDHTQGWDGTFNGTSQDIDVYFYFAEFTINGKRERIKGDVTLIR